MDITKKIHLPQAAKLPSPNPVTLVCTQKPDGSTGVARIPCLLSRFARTAQDQWSHMTPVAKDLLLH